MKKNMKRVFGLVLAVMLLVCTLPMNAMAAENFYTIDVGVTPLAGTGTGTGSSGNINIKGTTVLLNIFINGKLTTPARTVDISDYVIISDGSLNIAEVETVIDDYYKPANSNKGFQTDGIYYYAGNSIVEYATNSSKQSTWNNVNELRAANGTVSFNVYVPNVVAKSSGTADSSNPKTGDTIFVPVMVMGVTATALAAAYVFGKKRIAR